MRTRTNTNQLHFDFSPVRSDYVYSAPAPTVVVVVQPEPVTGTNATLETSPGSFHRVILHGESREGARLYRHIQFPGATYSNGLPRIQTVNGGVVTPDPF
jgi:hypothetical protein